jgi:hypothetical protein
LLAVVALLGAQPARAEAPAVERVTLRGNVIAMLRGEPTRFRFVETPGDLDATRYFEVTLTDPDEVEDAVIARARTEPDGSFTLRSVPVGNYVAQVRIPTIAPSLDHAILYRGRLEVKPGSPRQDVQLPVSFLYLRMQDAGGQPFAWTTLRLGIVRTGGELDQRWGQVVFSRGGLDGAGAVPERAGEGTILVRLQKGGFSFSWSSKEMGAVIFPVVEEDLPVRYRMVFSVPGVGYKIHRFSAARGKAPVELDCPLQPFSVLSGKVKLDGLTADVHGTSLTLTVLDPEDDSPESRSLQFASTNVKPDGSFKFPEVIAGLAEISAEIVGKNERNDLARGVAREWMPLKERENLTQLSLTVTPRTFDEPAPGDIYVTVVEGPQRAPVGRMKVELLAAGSEKGTTSVTSRDGRCSFMMRRPRAYILRVTDLQDGKPVVTEVPVTEEEVRRGVRKTITLGKQEQVT